MAGSRAPHQKRGAPSLPIGSIWSRVGMFELAILKLTAFCNLDCKYCYMFNLEDRTFSRVGRQMPLPTSLPTSKPADWKP